MAFSERERQRRGFLFCMRKKWFIKTKTISEEKKVLAAQSCLILCDPIDYSPPGFYVHEILKARLQERVAIPFSIGSSWLWDGTCVFCIAGGFFTVWATTANWASQIALVVKNLPAKEETWDMGWIPGSGKSPQGGHDFCSNMQRAGNRVAT